MIIYFKFGKTTKIVEVVNQTIRFMNEKKKN